MALRRAIVLTFDPNRRRAAPRAEADTGLVGELHRLVVKIARLERLRPNGRKVVERLVDRMLASGGDDHAA
jgi:hypothetical protein